MKEKQNTTRQHDVDEAPRPEHLLERDKDIVDKYLDTILRERKSLLDTYCDNHGLSVEECSGYLPRELNEEDQILVLETVDMVSMYGFGILPPDEQFVNIPDSLRPHLQKRDSAYALIRDLMWATNRELNVFMHVVVPTGQDGADQSVDSSGIITTSKKNKKVVERNYMAKGEKTPNVNAGQGIIGLEYSADKFHDADGKRIEDAQRKKLHGAQHWYAKDAEGKKTHISEDAMLERFGYGSDDFQGPRPTGESEKPAVNPATDPTTPGASSSEFMHSQEAKEALIEMLYEDMNSLTNAAVEFHQSGDMEKRDQAFWRYAKMFDTLGKVEGWDDAERARRLDDWQALVTYMLNRPRSTDPAPDPTVDPLDPTADPATAAAEAAANEKARLIVQGSTELTALSKKLDVSRDKLAKLNVEASGRIRIGAKLKAELEEARQEWEALQVEVGAKTMAHVLLLEAGASLDQLKGFAAMGAQKEAGALSEAQVRAIEAGPDGGRIKRFMHKYAQTYNSSGRIKKAFMLAPAGLIAGVGLGTIVGAIGGGIAAGIIARGAVKGALTAKMQSLRTREGQDLNVNGLGDDLDAEDAARVPHLLALRAATTNRKHTATEVSANSKENKQRAGKAIAIGSIAGIASGILANELMGQARIRGGGILEKTTGHRPHPIGGGYIHETPGGGNLTPTGGSSINPLEFAGSKGIDLGARDAWPFKIAGQLGLSEQDSISLAERSGFTFEGGRYWIGGRMMNYEEMKMHNLSLADIAARRAAGNSL
jgi:hypothetical protein